MLKKYLLVFLVSMVPLIELRGGVPAAMAMGISGPEAIALCAVGNMLPVPIIYFFARKVLLWGCDKKYIGKFFTYCIEKGEKGGRKLHAKGRRGGLFLALMLFVGIPLPGTGAWTASLIATLMQLRVLKSTAAIFLGVITCGIIMGILSFGIADLIM